MPSTVRFWVKSDRDWRGPIEIGCREGIPGEVMSVGDLKDEKELRPDPFRAREGKSWACFSR